MLSNPLAPDHFGKNTLFRFFDIFRVNMRLAPIYSKKRLQHESMPLILSTSITFCRIFARTCEFFLKFLSIFIHISRSINTVTPIWVSSFSRLTRSQSSLFCISWVSGTSSAVCYIKTTGTSRELMGKWWRFWSKDDDVRKGTIDKRLRLLIFIWKFLPSPTPSPSRRGKLNQL